jgi:pyruvate/2-oxoglutarate dehydrogenase complex dihydrolipoamide dehydrogenase (E3) component
VDFSTNRQAAIPTELTVSLAILGGGAIGIELGQAFARLGSRVTIIEAGPPFLASRSRRQALRCDRISRPMASC